MFCGCGLESAGWKGFGSGWSAPITIHERREGSGKPPQELHIWHTSTKPPVGFSSHPALLQWFIRLPNQRFTLRWVYMYGHMCAHVCASERGVYSCVGGWIWRFFRGGTVLQQMLTVYCLTRQRQPSSTHTHIPREKQVPPPNTSGDLWDDNYEFTTDLCEHSSSLISPFLSRHVAAREGDPDLGFHLLWTSEPQCPMGGILFLSSRFCGPVLWAVLPRIHPATPWRRASVALCAVQLPQAWNLSPRDR